MVDSICATDMFFLLENILDAIESGIEVIEKVFVIVSEANNPSYLVVIAFIQVGSILRKFQYIFSRTPSANFSAADFAVFVSLLKAVYCSNVLIIKK